MNYCLVIVILGACCFAEVFSDSVTPTVQCKGKSFDDLQQRIQIVPCGKQKCKLRRGTNITVNFRFKPEYEVRTLTNEVNANVAGIPLPFIGVTGTSACGQVSRADDGTAAPCPLQAGQEYTYTNVFPIEQFYPKTDMIVHWNIESDKGSVICFEVPAVITDAKKHGK